MSRYTGPRLRIMRALGTQLPGLSAKSIEKRPSTPGQHGPARKKRSASDYALRLREKQKVRFNYGLSERQMRRLVQDAARLRGNTGVVLIQLLERRLDNIVFRVGFARTIPGARQLVTHGHVTVNGRPVDRASFRVRRGDVIALRQGSRAIAERAQQMDSGMESPWLLVDRQTLTVTVASYPDDTFLPFELQPRLIIEHYSRAM